MTNTDIQNLIEEIDKFLALEKVTARKDGERRLMMFGNSQRLLESMQSFERKLTYEEK